MSHLQIIVIIAVFIQFVFEFVLKTINERHVASLRKEQPDESIRLWMLKFGIKLLVMLLIKVGFLVVRTHLDLLFSFHYFFLFFLGFMELGQLI